MADRPTFEDLVEQVRDNGFEELADQFDRFYGKSTLREEAGKVADLEKKLAASEAKVEKLEKAPLREKAFVDYGVDIEQLRPAERRALEGYDGELDREQIAAFVEEYDLPLLAGEQLETEQEAQPPAARIAAQAAAPVARRGPAQARITPDDVRKWNERDNGDKWRRFRQAHPNEAELILQGQTVEGMTFA